MQDAVGITFGSDRRGNWQASDITAASRFTRKISDPSFLASRPQRLARRQGRVPRISMCSAGEENEMLRTRSFPGLLRQMTTSSTWSSVRLLGRYRIKNDTHANSLLDMLSGLYAMSLIVMGATLPVAKVFSSELSLDTYEGFYIYLFVVGIGFITFIHICILHNHKLPTRHQLKQWCRRHERGEPEPKDTETNQSTAENGLLPENDQSIQQCSPDGAVSVEDVTFTMQPRSESLYLRLGAVAFGIGSMIHTGLKLGQFVELAARHGSDVELILVVRPLMQLIFTFVQLYFIFLNSTIRIHRHKAIARFGSMHLIGTNLCVWLRIITIEIVREMHCLLPGAVFGTGFHEAIGRSVYSTENSVRAPSIGEFMNYTGLLNHVNMSTSINSSVMDHIVDFASPYLYPCAIEYCFIAGAVQFMIWSNISSRCLTPSTVNDEPRPNSQISLLALHKYHNQQVNVDCSGANRGLFCGILVLVLTVISIIVFFIYVSSPGWHQVAVVIQYSTQITLYIVTTLIVVVAAYRFKDLRFTCDKQAAGRRIDEILLVLSLIGVFLFRVFSSIAGHFTSGGSLVTAANVIIIVQAVVQTVFLLNGLHRKARNAIQQTTKPGRDAVTLLLLCNIAIWAVNIFQVLRSDTNAVSISFYGPVPWTIIAHIAIPLALFHQFHATVCLSTIWKTAYKFKSD